MQATQDPRRRSYWLKTLHQWHWISSAVCLLGMVLFAATGITLNHARQIEASPRVTTQTAALPESLLPLARQAAQDETATLPSGLSRWLETTWSLRISGRVPEWTDGELYLSLPRPGGDAWVSVDTTTGEATYEATDRGWIAYLNDLHKGRNTGPWWSWFIDVFAVAALVFSLSGLFLLQLHARQRPTTWPVVGLGVIVPVLIALLLIH
jgi:uncharacterized protein